MTGLTEKNMDYTTAPVYIFLLGDLRTNVGLPMFIRYDDCGPDDFRSLEEVMEFARRARNWNIGSHSRGSDKSGKQ